MDYDIAFQSHIEIVQLSDNLAEKNQCLKRSLGDLPNAQIRLFLVIHRHITSDVSHFSLLLKCGFYPDPQTGFKVRGGNSKWKLTAYQAHNKILEYNRYSKSVKKIEKNLPVITVFTFLA